MHPGGQGGEAGGGVTATSTPPSEAERQTGSSKQTFAVETCESTEDTRKLVKLYGVNTIYH